VKYRFEETVYNIMVNQGSDRETTEIFMEAEMQPGQFFQLTNDKKEHEVTIEIGRKAKTEIRISLATTDV
jgi:hypothetical protein